MSWLVKAKDSIDAKKYDEALGYLEKALKDNPKSQKAYLERSIVYQRIGKYQESFVNSENAIAWAHANGNREVLGEAQLRRAIALLSLERPKDALHSLQLAGKYGCKDKSMSVWQAKIEKAANDAENTLEISIKDIPEVSLHEMEENENDEELVKSATNHQSETIQIKPASFTTPKTQAAFEKNWDKVASELDDDNEEDKSGKNDDPMDFFRMIYDKADPDTQRAMMKSYIESNGTTLSTNWEDVKKGKVETSPPDGMQTKKW